MTVNAPDNDLKPSQFSQGQTEFLDQVRLKSARKRRAQREGTRGIWIGLGMSGLIGWSVAAPTLVGAMAGIWLDRRHPGPHSWTLTLLVAGLVIGCLNAWRWVAQEGEAMHEEPEDEA